MKLKNTDAILKNTVVLKNTNVNTNVVLKNTNAILKNTVILKNTNVILKNTKQM